MNTLKYKLFLNNILRISEISQIPNGLCGVYYLLNKNSEIIYYLNFKRNGLDFSLHLNFFGCSLR